VKTAQLVVPPSFLESIWSQGCRATFSMKLWAEAQLHLVAPLFVPRELARHDCPSFALSHWHGPEEEPLQFGARRCLRLHAAALDANTRGLPTAVALSSASGLAVTVVAPPRVGKHFESVLRALAQEADGEQVLADEHRDPNELSGGQQ
jgi:hypothetical protein